MSKHALSNEKESAGKILKKFMHVIGINHRLRKWILPCNLGKNIIMAGLPYVGIVYGCDILNALVAQDTKSNIMIWLSAYFRYDTSVPYFGQGRKCYAG